MASGASRGGEAFVMLPEVTAEEIKKCAEGNVRRGRKRKRAGEQVPQPELIQFSTVSNLDNILTLFSKNSTFLKIATKISITHEFASNTIVQFASLR